MSFTSAPDKLGMAFRFHDGLQVAAANSDMKNSQPPPTSGIIRSIEGSDAEIRKRSVGIGRNQLQPGVRRAELYA